MNRFGPSIQILQTYTTAKIFQRLQSARVIVGFGEVGRAVPELVVVVIVVTLDSGNS